MYKIKEFLQNGCKNEPGRYFSVVEIEVYTDLCRVQTLKYLKRLVKTGSVECQVTNGRSRYRWIGAEW